MTEPMKQMPLEEQREDLQRRLTSHRQKIERKLAPRQGDSTALAPSPDSFPRSRLLQLLLGKPLVLAAAALVGAVLLRRRAGGLLPAAFAVFRFFRKATQSTDTGLPA